MEYVAPGVEVKPLDTEKELKLAEQRQKEQDLKEMKAKLVRLEKEKTLRAKLKEGDPKEQRVDNEGDGQAYFAEGFTKYYTGIAGVEKWFGCPTLGQWAAWGMERPGNITEDQWVDAGLEEARKLLKKFEGLKAQRDEERRAALQNDPLVQAEIAKAREAAEAEKAKLLAELEALRAAAAAGGAAAAST
eukprot:TRINITY_DN8613_c0_g1_i1.p2 TRINITY_DN8613_c0_g1~~TRINITY_DN8613_c0_g1_i1.p2  ORF type:complete len:189 (+),score=89.36 TRINITY_DN8613_c0_g1_i1:178-744(+)